MKRPPAAAETMGLLGEDEAVRRIISLLPSSRRILTGAGDDCAVLPGSDKDTAQLFKADCVVEGVHFLPDARPADIGWKALCRAISDIAAMGGLPTSALITLAAPKSTAWQRVQGIYHGLRKAAEAYGVAIVGGETTSLPQNAPLLINVALLGTVRREHVTLRSGARAGDALLVTGVLGGTRRRWHLEFTPRVAEANWLVRSFKPTAMMDLSDGLAKDLPRLAEASKAGFHVMEGAVPVRRGASREQAFTDGEDFELLFTLPQESIQPCLKAWKRKFPRLPLSVIGSIVPRSKTIPLSWTGGWDHFRA